MDVSSGSPRSSSRHSLRFDLSCYALALAVIVAVGALNIIYPFVADQVIALTAARTLDQGGVLYVDFWDNKMPGLFWFYRIAGELFGYDETGVHTLELIWMTAFAVIMMAGLRDYFHYTWMSAAAPLAVIAVYYVSADAFHLTQLEMLVTLPIFVAAWLGARPWSSSRARTLAFFGSGLCAGVTVVFKIVFAPLFVVFWALISLHFVLTRQSGLKAIMLSLWLPAAAGVTLVLGLVAIKFWLDGALYELWWTAFIYPPQALATVPSAPYLRLGTSVLFFASYYSIWTVFIVVAIAEWWQRERDLFTTLLLGWLLCGIVLIVIQRFSWWPYHFLSLFPPAGILGVRGVSALCSRVLQQSTLAAAATPIAAILLFPAIAAIAVPASQKMLAHIEVFLVKDGGVDDFRRFVNREYAQIGRSVTFLRSESARPGAIYVFGDPLYYHLSGREPALPIPGWAWHFFLESQWVQLPRQLAQANPPYVYVDRDSKKILEMRDASVKTYLAERYLPMASDHNGIWYQLRPDLW